MQVQELTLQEMEQVNGGGLLGGGLLGLLGKGCCGILKLDADVDLDLDLDIEIC
ncbi:hypothetical protein [Niastella populi]|uniref:hypothetical protein n=1 Tax=Niastella populi TaxID=550983 RepID=UPI0013FD8117|nr:hypothetical protein [Niastella populi]